MQALANRDVRSCNGLINSSAARHSSPAGWGQLHAGTATLHGAASTPLQPRPKSWPPDSPYCTAHLDDLIHSGRDFQSIVDASDSMGDGETVAGYLGHSPPAAWLASTTTACDHVLDAWLAADIREKLEDVAGFISRR